jgi:hypothetical protein
MSDDVTPRFKGMAPTNRKRKVKAVKEEATRLHSQIVRAMKGPLCQCGCGQVATDCAHIIGRTFAHTRTDIDNAYALNAKCHALFGQNHGMWMDFVDRTIGRAEYDRLWRKAQDGVSKKFDWYSELDRLKAIWQEMREAA